ncbi:YidB family protein [Pseudomarimonas salicorniae]|uniref:YidB family protein n=1 Tax=Pseudomarimonas salicorniae TaxID=2933270 RepID=A0ABT0GK08_9GAMM|nr:YidB family protein [Lysobacter sp. CAU 1642]MCK7594865.1 YidB family protein [Lysobacter sp. CAU 1642]
MGLLDDLMGAGLGAAGGKDGTLGGLGGVLGGLGDRGNPFGDMLRQFGGGGGATQGASLMVALMGLVQRSGGFESVIKRFEEAGLGGLVQSWLSPAPNAALGAEQLQSVFGAEAMAQAAQQAGLSTQQATRAISDLLPELINQFSPGGQLASNHADLLQQGLSILSGGRR